MAVALAKTVFECGPDDTLQAVDIYTLDGNSVVTDIADINNTFSVDALSGLQGGNLLDGSALDTLINSISAIGNELLMDASSLINGILSLSPDLLSALYELSELLQLEITDPDINKNANRDKKNTLQSNINVTINGVSTLVKNANLSDLTGVGKLVTKMSGSSLPYGFKDNSALVILSVNIIKAAAKLGIPGAFTAFANGALSDPKLLMQVALALMPFVIQTSNLELFTEIATSHVGKNLFIQFPDIVTNFVKNYNNKVIVVNGIRIVNFTTEYDKTVRNNKTVIGGTIGESNTNYVLDYLMMQSAFNSLSPTLFWTTRGDFTEPVINARHIPQATPAFYRSITAYVDSLFLNIDTSHPDTLDTTNFTVPEMYALLCSRFGNINTRQVAKDTFPYSNIKVF